MFGVILIPLGLVIAAYPLLQIIRWWIDGEIEPGVAVGAIFLYIVLIASVMAGPSPLKLAVLVVLILSTLAMPAMTAIVASRQNQRMEDDRVRAFTTVLERNPMDAVARVALAEELARRERIDEAIEQMEWVLQRFPRLQGSHGYQLESWRRARDRRGMPEPIFCHMCNAENPGDAVLCATCGAMFGTKTGMVQKVWRDGGPRRVLRAWLVTSGALTSAAFLLTVAPHFLPIEVIGILVIATVLVAAFLFLRWVGGEIGVAED